MTIKGGRKMNRTERVILYGVSATAALVAVILVIFTVYDIAVGRWIDLPLDLIFGVGAVAIAYFARRKARLAAHSRRA